MAENISKVYWIFSIEPICINFVFLELQAKFLTFKKIEPTFMQILNIFDHISKTVWDMETPIQSFRWKTSKTIDPC